MTALDGHYINGRKIEASFAKSQSEYELAKVKPQPDGELCYRRILVGNIPTNVNPASIQSFLESFGDITSWDLKMDRYTGGILRYGFVTFLSVKSADALMDKGDCRGQIQYDGQSLTLKYATAPRDYLRPKTVSAIVKVPAHDVGPLLKDGALLVRRVATLTSASIQFERKSGRGEKYCRIVAHSEADLSETIALLRETANLGELPYSWAEAQDDVSPLPAFLGLRARSREMRHAMKQNTKSILKSDVPKKLLDLLEKLDKATES